MDGVDVGIRSKMVKRNMESHWWGTRIGEERKIESKYLIILLSEWIGNINLFINIVNVSISYMSMYVLSILILCTIVKVSGKREVKINKSLYFLLSIFAYFVFVLIDLASYYHVCKCFECKCKKIIGYNIKMIKLFFLKKLLLENEI